jgi:hypothetical protein
MSIGSLSKFTVPLASDSSSSAQGILMPKLKYRFRIMFENFGVSTPTTELTKQVAASKRPVAKFGDIKLEVYNSTMHLAGRGTWDPITVDLRDDVTGSVSKLVGEQMQKQFDFFEQSSAASGGDYKFLMRIEMLDGGNGVNQPNVLETWELYGCYVSQVNYGEVNYASGTDLVKIALTIKFDNAVQTPLGFGVGSDVGRLSGETATG